MSGYFLDWIQFTIKEETEMASEAMGYLFNNVNIEIEDGEVRHGFNGYKSMVVFPSGIKVMYNGEIGMGVNITIPGKALDNPHFSDSIEAIEDKLKFNGYQYKWTRLDFAVDTEKYDFSVFYDKFVKKEYRCKYRTDSISQNVNANNRGTLYFGKRGGLTMFRIYDKALEQGQEGTWTRIEIESRNEACVQLLKAYKDGTIGQYFNGHLDFVKERKKNMARCETDVFYLEVLKGEGKKRKVERKESDKQMDWITSQVAPTVKALIMEYGEDEILKIFNDAKISKRMAKERFHIEIINKMEKVNTLTGQILTREYIQQTIEDGHKLVKIEKVS